MTALAERRAELQAVQRAAFARWFSPAGREHAPATDPRVAWQVALVLLGGTAAERKLAQAILRHAACEPCHFRPAYAASILVRHGTKLAVDVRQRVEDYLLASLPGASTRDIRYHGYNDNFPSLATATLALAARLFDRPDARERARANLLDLRDLMGRRAWISEFNSPTYTPITLAALAETAEFADDDEVRQLALHGEHRVWDDIAAHWHGPTCHPAGPFSRAYECDRVAQFTSLHIPVWLVSGDACALDPRKSLFPPPPEQVVHHDDDVRFVQGFTAALGAAPYHPSDGLAARLGEKRLPLAVNGDCEAGAMGEFSVAGQPRILYGATANSTTTWLGSELSLGTSRRPFLDGNQSCAFFATWRKRSPVRGLADMRSCFALYAVNDQTPGQRNASPLHPAGLDRGQIYDHGRCVALQHQGTAMVLYRPKLDLAGHAIRRLALQVVVPLHAGAPPRLWLDGHPLTHPAAQHSEPVPVTLHEGRTVLHFRPLTLNHHGRCRAGTTVEVRHRYLVISFFNFEAWGPRTFSERDLAATANGFVCEAAEVASPSALDDALRGWQSARLEDEFYSDRRIVRYTRPELDLRLAWTPASETLQYAVINGQSVA